MYIYVYIDVKARPIVLDIWAKCRVLECHLAEQCFIGGGGFADKIDQKSGLNDGR